MDLNNQECYQTDNRLIIKPMLPGDEGFVWQPLPDREYDLSPLDPSKPTIHVLADDAMMEILKYLPLMERIVCEIICRRWQTLLYVMFKSTTHLNLDQSYLMRVPLIFSKTKFKFFRTAMLSKMLLLTGKSLNSLSFSGRNDEYVLFDNSDKYKLILMMAQLCPNLECFSAKKCLQLNERAFKKLISVMPCLVKIDVSHTAIKGNCFNLLPESLKELDISFSTLVLKEKLIELSKTCKI
ncbi:unnamed protein product [Meganyctiphanes norvegica]|uniref:F-box domain-containing protein n=1 Tax=Meganyctiphanes norvegica TaxID=48144 RepID=A0AAV2SI27_MEGNR